MVGLFPHFAREPPFSCLTGSHDGTMIARAASASTISGLAGASGDARLAISSRCESTQITSCVASIVQTKYPRRSRCARLHRAQVSEAPQEFSERTAACNRYECARIEQKLSHGEAIHRGSDAKNCSARCCKCKSRSTGWSNPLTYSGRGSSAYSPTPRADALGAFEMRRTQWGSISAWEILGAQWRSTPFEQLNFHDELQHAAHGNSLGALALHGHDVWVRFHARDLIRRTALAHTEAIRAITGAAVHKCAVNAQLQLSLQVPVAHRPARALQL